MTPLTHDIAQWGALLGVAFTLWRMGSVAFTAAERRGVTTQRQADMERRLEALEKKET